MTEPPLPSPLLHKYVCGGEGGKQVRPKSEMRPASRRRSLGRRRQVGAEIIVVGGDGTLGQFADRADGVGAASGADWHPMPKIGIQVVRRWRIGEGGVVLLGPSSFGCVNMGQSSPASNRGIVRLRSLVLLAAAAQCEEQQEYRDEFRLVFQE